MAKKYSLELKQETIDLGGETYTLKEMSGAVRDQYTQEFSNRMTTSADGKTTIKNYNGLQAKLVSFCLFDKDDKPVSEEAISKWPASTVEALFHDAQMISGIIKGEKEAKNGSPGSV